MKLFIIFSILLCIVLPGCCRLYFLSNPVPVIDSKKIEAMRDCFNIAASVPYKYEVCGDDTWQSPCETVSKNTGDCEDKAIYLQYLLKMKGIDSQVCFGKVEAEDEVYHAWIECINIHEVYVLDPTNMVFINRYYLKTVTYVKYDDLSYVIDKIHKYEYFNNTILNKTYKK